MPSAVDKAYDEVRSGILSGRLAPGDRLPEEELAADIGVSRTPVREALRRLAGDGLVEFLPNRGAHVSAWSDADLKEIYGLRALLEGHAARLAAERITDDEIASLQALVDEMDRLAAARRPDLDAIAEANGQFHALVMEAASTRRLGELVAGLVQVPLVQRTFHRYSPADLKRSLSHHHDLVRALAEGDGPWAEAVMRSHILAARDVLRRHRPA